MSLTAWSKFADGVPELAGSWVLADQYQCGLEIQARGEDPADHDIIDALGKPGRYRYRPRSSTRSGLTWTDSA